MAIGRVMLEAFLVDPVGLETDLPHLVGVKEPAHDGVAFRMQLPLYIVHDGSRSAFAVNATMHAIKKQRAFPMARVEAAKLSLRLRQATVIALLFGGYASLYFCRADLSVSTPLLIDELGGRGLNHADAIVRMGQVSSLGCWPTHSASSFWEAWAIYGADASVFSLAWRGAAAFTLLFTVGATVLLFMIAWIGNRLTQSIAWAGLIKVSSKWFDYTTYGSVIGILSISYLVGDAAARQWMGMLMQHGFGWRALFYFAAAVAGAMLLFNGLFLRESRKDLRFDEAKPNPLNLFGAEESRPSLRSLLLPLLRSRAFLLICRHWGAPSFGKPSIPRHRSISSTT